LADLRKLQKLSLFKNKIRDLSPLSGLASLQDLDLQYNQISNIDALGSLPNLENLELEGNQVSGIHAQITNARISCRRTFRRLMRAAGLPSLAVNPTALVPALLVLIPGMVLLVVGLVALRLWRRRGRGGHE